MDTIERNEIMIRVTLVGHDTRFRADNEKLTTQKPWGCLYTKQEGQCLSIGFDSQNILNIQLTGEIL